MEVAPGIHRIELASEAAAVAIYALFGEHVVLVDAGFAGAVPAVDAYLSSHGRALSEVRACIITHAHADHFGGAADLIAAVPGAEIAAHPEDVAWIEDPVRHVRENYAWADEHGLEHPARLYTMIGRMLGPGVPVQRALRDGDTVSAGGGWDLGVVHVPGHSRGHVALLDARSGSLLVADAVNEPGPNPPIYFDAGIYRETLRRIRALDARRLLGAHYPIREAQEAAELLAGATAYAETCGRVVEEALAAARGPLGVADLATTLLQRMGVGEEPRRWAWAAQGHVAALERQGRLVRRPMSRDRDARPVWEVRR